MDRIDAQTGQAVSFANSISVDLEGRGLRVVAIVWEGTSNGVNGGGYVHDGNKVAAHNNQVSHTCFEPLRINVEPKKGCPTLQMALQIPRAGV